MNNINAIDKACFVFYFDSEKNYFRSCAKFRRYFTHFYEIPIYEKLSSVWLIPRHICTCTRREKSYSNLVTATI